jgi:hypothetical protein
MFPARASARRDPTEIGPARPDWRDLYAGLLIFTSAAHRPSARTRSLLRRPTFPLAVARPLESDPRGSARRQPSRSLVATCLGHVLPTEQSRQHGAFVIAASTASCASSRRRVAAAKSANMVSRFSLALPASPRKRHRLAWRAKSSLSTDDQGSGFMSNWQPRPADDFVRRIFAQHTPWRRNRRALR